MYVFNNGKTNVEFYKVEFENHTEQTSSRLQTIAPATYASFTETEYLKQIVLERPNVSPGFGAVPINGKIYLSTLDKKRYSMNLD